MSKDPRDERAQESNSDRHDPRHKRAEAAGLKAHGLDLREDYGQNELQERADKIAALGHVPSDGSLDGPVEGVVLEALPDEDREHEREPQEPADGGAGDEGDGNGDEAGAGVPAMTRSDVPS